MRKLIIVSVALSLALPLLAAVKLPQASPAATVSQEVGMSSVKISYHRPGVKGRKIWGGLVPLGQVWRFGANEATTLELSHPAKVAGKDVAAGKYALFAIPGEKEWTLVLNSQAEQWGAYSHDQSKDALRFTVAPQSGEMTEWFTISMRPILDNAIEVIPAWEKIRVPFMIEFDTPKLVWAGIDAELAKNPEDPTALLQSARYSFSTGQRADQAMQWVDKSIAVKESFWNHELKARMLQKNGDVKNALVHMDKAIAMAEAAKAPAELVENWKKDRASWVK